MYLVIKNIKNCCREDYFLYFALQETKNVDSNINSNEVSASHVPLKQEAIKSSSSITDNEAFKKIKRSKRFLRILSDKRI